MPSFASLMRAINADEGFRAVAKFPRARTTLCKPGAKSRRSAAARASMSFSLMNASTSSLLGQPAPPGTARLPFARISLILARSSVEGSWLPVRRPHDSTARFTVGELLRSVSAALSPIPDSLMKSSMLLELGRPCPLPPAQEPEVLPLRSSARASRMRASRAAEGFLAVDRSPRAKARR